ncbi:MAG TPA: hypothetical protein VHG93_15465 [Longimicrobium sp.]|nr:hypothetical protein [Longimicrobium sp.]
MDLGKLNRDAEDRSVVWGAVVASVIALVSLIQAALAAAAGDRVNAAVLAVVGAVQLALAYGVYRGSRACAVAVLGLWIVDRLIGFAAYGPGYIVSIWTLVFTVMLFAGMRGVFAQHARTPRPDAGSRRPA